MPFTVGLTGGIGSGKSAAAQVFEELGTTVIDTDAIAHALTAQGGAAIEPIRCLRRGLHYILTNLPSARACARWYSPTRRKNAF
jgi:dephospho-CoA kinase